ncbi:MAG: DUF4910 domain-containing protein [Candidatus Omnitrophota bacterium]
MITAKEMRKIISDLYLKDRTMVCDDYDYCLNYLKRYLDFTIYEYPSSRAYWNWIIPDKYTVREAYIRDVKTSKILIDSKDHPLHLASYSAPFSGVLDYEELRKHLYWNEKVPGAIPNYYKLQYRPWEKDWKFCLSYNQLKRFNKKGMFEIKIDTLFEKGTLKVAEYLKKGRTKDTIVIVSHLDHPGQVNDGLSGVVVELALMREIAERDTHYSYLFLIVQEFLGSVAYLSDHMDIVKDLKMGIFAEMLTTGLKPQLQKSFTGVSYIDRIAEMVFKERLERFDILDYLEGAGNDEIVFESPGIEVPFISVMRARSKGKLYRQYHTHLDNLEMVDDKQLDEALKLLTGIVDTLEEDFYIERKFEGFICLSNPNLGIYFNENEFICGRKIDSAVQARLHSFLFGGFRYFDGCHRISDIAIRYEIPFEILLEFIKRMERKGLVALSPNKKTVRECQQEKVYVK